MIIVRLPGPGEAFTAIAGVDSNDQTSGGRGSVQFIVAAKGAVAFKTGVMREGMPGAPVTASLGGATEFVLQVDDGGDGISCDQADWAQAKVRLRDGRVIWLADLPLEDGAARPPLSTEPPFAFNLDGKPFASLGWAPARASRKLDAARSEHTLVYADPKSGLQVRCVAVEYHDFPTLEWTVYFTNTGSSDSPLISDIQALDASFHRAGAGEFVLHHHKGTFVRPDDFEPLVTTDPSRAAQNRHPLPRRLSSQRPRRDRSSTW